MRAVVVEAVISAAILADEVDVPGSRGDLRVEGEGTGERENGVRAGVSRAIGAMTDDRPRWFVRSLWRENEGRFEHGRGFYGRTRAGTFSPSSSSSAMLSRATRMFISGASARPTEKAGPPSARRKLRMTPELTQSPSGKPSSGSLRRHLDRDGRRAPEACPRRERLAVVELVVGIVRVVLEGIVVRVRASAAEGERRDHQRRGEKHEGRGECGSTRAPGGVTSRTGAKGEHRCRGVARGRRRRRDGTAMHARGRRLEPRAAALIFQNNDAARGERPVHERHAFDARRQPASPSASPKARLTRGTPAPPPRHP